MTSSPTAALISATLPAVERTVRYAATAVPRCGFSLCAIGQKTPRGFFSSTVQQQTIFQRFQVQGFLADIYVLSIYTVYFYWLIRAGRQPRDQMITDGRLEAAHAAHTSMPPIPFGSAGAAALPSGFPWARRGEQERGHASRRFGRGADNLRGSITPASTRSQ